jgi:UDP-glucuronate 4-epimerase
MILVTGCAGFIGFHATLRLLRGPEPVIGIDNLSAHYDGGLKRARLDQLTGHKHFAFEQIDISDRASISRFLATHKPEKVLHLAAQAGVRQSLTSPHLYTESNITGFLNILEGCRNNAAKHLVFASSSSVYGLNTSVPYSVHANVDHPISLYAATKKANELMAHSYSHLFNLPTTGLRLFTVYGPWGRPDMALFLFTKAILEGKSIDVFDNGTMSRDFTYIDDVVEALVRTLDHPATPNPDWRGDSPDSATSSAPYRLYNLGNHSPVQLLRLIQIVEHCVQKKAVIRMLPRQPGEMLETYADVSELHGAIGFEPATSIEVGVDRFVHWFRVFYQI